MKKLRLLFSTLALLLCSISISAHDFEVDGIYYQITSGTNLKVRVTYEGSYYYIYDEYKGSVIIPESVTYNGKTYSVTSIGDYAFSDCSGLTSVTIPNSVTRIGDYAFSDCSGLTSVTIPNSVTRIGDYAFYDCSGLTSVTIGNSVTRIGNSAFEYCSGLTSVTIPNSVTIIGGEAFDGCENLRTVINNSNLDIVKGSFNYGLVGYYAYRILSGENINGYYFDENNGEYTLTGYWGDETNLVLPENYKGNAYSINNDAFYSCSGLTSVTIPNSVTSIGNWAFYKCSGLTSVTIPNSVTSIGEYAFSGCYFVAENFVNQSELTNVNHWGANLCDEEVRGLVIDDDAVVRCRPSVTIAVIPNSVTSIGNETFYGCSGLTSVTIPNSVTSIGDRAFVGAELRTIVCLNSEVPAVGSDVYGQVAYNHATLYVPEDTYWDYAYNGWGKFIHIKEIAMTDEALASSKAYMIADAKGCNYTVYDAGKDELVNVEYTFALDEENEGACWTVMKEGGESYLYNIGAKKFAAMNEDGKLSLSDAPVNLDITTTESGLSINGNARMFVLNDKVDVDVTAINGITADCIDDADVPVYNLQGMKMQNADNLPAGIYIKNGKKYSVK